MSIADDPQPWLTGCCHLRWVRRDWWRVVRCRVQPLQDLLHRIKWDPEFGKGDFALGYYDRVAHEETVVPFASIDFDPHWPGTFSVLDASGTEGRIPLHRVRTVYKDGAVIWQRPHPAGK